MFGSVFGMNSGLLGNAQNAVQGSGGIANQYSSPLQQNIHNQQALYNQYAQGMFNQMAADRKENWMVNGKRMSYELFPDPDDAMRTFLTLKYKGRDDNTKTNI
jgi:hypothetical protein